MKLHILSAAALAFSLIGGAAIAQESPRFDSDPSMIKPFFSDEGMTTMRSAEEMAAAFAAMTPDNQTMMRDECSKNSSPRYEALCAEIAKM